jgi:hypothetical protein
MGMIASQRSALWGKKINKKARLGQQAEQARRLMVVRIRVHTLR